MSPAATRAAASPEAGEAPSKDEVIAELRQLVADLHDAAQDGRMLAKRYADLLTQCVDEYCVEFEQRAKRVLDRLEQAQ